MSKKTKLAMANNIVAIQMSHISGLLEEIEVAERHLKITERELAAKERLIIELKDWITTLIQGEK